MTTFHEAPDDKDGYRWLTSADAAPWLDRAAAATQSTLSLTAELRRDLSPMRRHLVIEQVDLRRRAQSKFMHAGQMFFTSRGLEQATDEFVAAYKARRFPPREPVADLCCGIGGDLLALAARRPVTGVDRDPVIAILAAANSRAVSAQLVVADVTPIDIRGFAVWHIDPDRRALGRRTTRVELYEPAPQVIDALRTMCPNGAAKLAPAATVPEAWSCEAEQEWISRDGECRQLVCWFGALAHEPGRRRATIVDHRSPEVRSIVGQAGDELPVAAALGQYLYEPDAAVLAAGLTATLAEEHSLSAITPGIAYLTADRTVVDLALASFRVREVFPFDIRKLRGALRERNIGRLEIKKRGVACQPETLRHELKLAGDAAATLILLPIAGRSMAILAERAP